MFEEMYVLPVLTSQPIVLGYLLPIGCTILCMLISFSVCQIFKNEWCNNSL